MRMKENTGRLSDLRVGAGTPSFPVNPTIEISSYALSIIGGLRSITKRSGKDLEFLDYLLAMAQEEASRLRMATRH